MKTVLRFGLMSLVCVFAAFMASAQPVKKKVAVYVTGSDVDNAIKKVLGAKIVTSITSSGEFAAVERTSEFLAALSKESDYQTSGEVRDSQIAKLGQKFGVKYVVVADVSEAFDELFVAARLINVETGLVEKAFDANGPTESMQQLIELSKNVAGGLLKDLYIGQGGSRYSGTSGGGQVERFSVNGVTFEMVRVDGGSFIMGSYNGESNEQPVHSETVGTFYIGRTEVTQKLWSAVMGSNPSSFRGEHLPVESVSWYDCQEFVERLSRLTGRIFRLPTEAEWEYAARGGSKSKGYTYSGSEDVYRVAWYSDNSGGTTHPVGLKLDNELGIFDMSGNVWEWCSDNYSSSYSQPRNSSSRVHRGGGWNYAAAYCRVANRYYYAPGNRYYYLGLRLAL